MLIFDEKKRNQIESLMLQGVHQGVFPGGALFVSQGGVTRFSGEYGKANLFTGEPVTSTTVFDLASLTKPLATTLAVMRLIEQGKMSLNDRLGDLMPAFRGSGKESITPVHLLSHTSGLPDYQPYFLELSKVKSDKRREYLMTLLQRESLVASIGEKVLYSDIGFMILGLMVEYLSGKRLDCFLADEVYVPMKLKRLLFIRLDDSGNKWPLDEMPFAATEKCSWRRKVLRGQVHDDNAYSMGGVAGHAGLFGAIGEIHELLKRLLFAYQGAGEGSILQPEMVRTFLSSQGSSGRTLGFDMPSENESSSGRFFSRNSVGHLGFTGTSFWMDLDRGIIVVLLTNRVHPSRENDLIRKFRPEIHDAVMKNN